MNVYVCGVVLLVGSRVLFWICSRPKNVDEISHQEHVVATLKTSIASGQLPHLLFYGPPGTGKSSLNAHTW